MLFKKAAVFGDIHFGKKNNSRQYNIDCEKFIQWFIDESRKFNAEICIFLGDWHDNRRVLNVQTLNYSLSSLELLSKNFCELFFVLGNHDLYYKEKREINSVEFSRAIKNIKIIKEITEISDCVFIPWLVEGEYSKVKELKGKYAFGHLELPNFIMNDKNSMPDKGELKLEDFKNFRHVFSGHFHFRQTKRNITYIGNAFPQNYIDSWDTNRGAMFLEWNKKPIFKHWPEQPVYIKVKLSEIIENVEKYLNRRTYAKILIDIDLNYNEMLRLRDTLQNIYNPREIIFVPEQARKTEKVDFCIDELKSVDEIVIRGLKSLEKNAEICPEMLIRIYKNLEEKEEK